MLSNRVIQSVARVVVATYITQLMAPVLWASEGGVEVLIPQNSLATQRMVGGVSFNPLPLKTPQHSSGVAFGPLPPKATPFGDLFDDESSKLQAQAYQYRLKIKTSGTDADQLSLKLSRKVKDKEGPFEHLHSADIHQGFVKPTSSRAKDREDDVLKNLFKDHSVYYALEKKPLNKVVWSLPGLASLTLTREGKLLLNQESNSTILSHYDLVLKTSGDLLLGSLNVSTLTLESPTTRVLGLVSATHLHTDHQVINEGVDINGPGYTSEGGLRIHQLTGTGSLINHGLIRWEGTPEQAAVAGIRHLHNVPGKTSRKQSVMRGGSLHITKENQSFINEEEAEVSLANLHVEDVSSPTGSPSFLNKGKFKIDAGTFDRKVLNAGKLTVKNHLKVTKGRNTGNIVTDSFWMPEGTFTNSRKLKASSLNLERGTFHNLPKGSLTVSKTTKVGDAHLQNEGVMQTGSSGSGSGQFIQENGKLINTGTWTHSGDVVLGSADENNFGVPSFSNKGTVHWQQGSVMLLDSCYWLFLPIKKCNFDTSCGFYFENHGSWVLDHMGCDPLFGIKNHAHLLFKGGSMTLASLVNHKDVVFESGQYTISYKFLSSSGILENNATLHASFFQLEGGSFRNLPKGNLTVSKTAKVKDAYLHNEGKLVTGAAQDGSGQFTQSGGEFANTGYWEHTGDISLERIKFANKIGGTLLWQKGKWTSSGIGMYWNGGDWTLDQIICSSSPNISNGGILHLKEGKIDFEHLINNKTLLFGGGQYTVQRYLYNDHVVQFLNHDWAITDEPLSKFPNCVVLKNPREHFSQTTQQNAFLKKIEIKNKLIWDLQYLPKLHVDGDIVFSARHRNARTLADLANITTPGKVTFYIPSLTTTQDYDFPNIGHLDLHINDSRWYGSRSAFTNHHTFTAPALTLSVNGPLTCGESNERMGTIDATTGPLSITAHSIDGKYGKFRGEVGPVHLKSTRGDIMVGAPVDIEKGSPFIDGESSQTGPYIWKEKNRASVISGGSLTLESATQILIDYGNTFSGGEQLLKAGQLVRNLASSFTSLGKVIIRAPEYTHTRAQKISNAPPWDTSYIIIPEVLGSDPAIIKACDNIEIYTQKTTNVASKMRSEQDIWINGIKVDAKTMDLTQQISSYMEQVQNLYGITWVYKYYWENGCDKLCRDVTPLLSTETCSLVSKKDIHINMGDFGISGRIGTGGLWLHGTGNGRFDGTSFRAQVTPTGAFTVDLTRRIVEEAPSTGAFEKNSKRELVPLISQGGPRVTSSQIMYRDERNQHLYQRLLNPTIIINPLKNLSLGLFELYLHSAVADITGRMDFEGSRELEDHARRLSRQASTSLITQDHLQHATTMLLLNSLQEVGEYIEEHVILYVPPQAIKTTRGISAQTVDSTHDGDLTTENYEIEAEGDISLVAGKKNLLLTTPRRIIQGNVTQDIIDTQTKIISKKGRTYVQGGEHVGIKGAVVEGDQGVKVRTITPTSTIDIGVVPLYRTETYRNVKDGGPLRGETVADIHLTSTALLSSKLGSNHADVEIESGSQGSTTITGAHISAPTSAIVLGGGDVTTTAGIAGTTVITSSHTSGGSSSSNSSSTTHTVVFSPVVFESRYLQVNTKKALFTGTDFIAQILYDNSETGAQFKSTLGRCTFFNQTVSESSFSKTDMGCEGWYEVMQPCRFAIQKIIQKINDKEMLFESVEWGEKRPEIIGKFAETTYQLKQWQRSWNEVDQAIPDEALVVVALGITIATQGWGASFATSMFGLGTTASGMVGAGVASVATQFGTSFLRTGDPLNAAASLFTNQYLRSLGSTIVTSGLIGNGPGIVEGFTQRLMENGIRSVVKASVSSALEGRKLSETMKDAGINTVVDSISGSIAEKIGQAVHTKVNPLSPIEHKLAHFALGCGMGAATGVLLGHDNLLTDAITSGAGAVIGESVAEALSDREQLKNETLLEMKQRGLSYSDETYKTLYRKKLQPYIATGRLVAGSVIAAMDKDPTLAIAAATNALENNFVLVDDVALAAVAIAAVSLGLIDQTINGPERAKQIQHFFEKDGDEVQQQQAMGNNGTSGATPPEDWEPDDERDLGKELHDGKNTGFSGKSGFELKNPRFQPARNQAQIINGREFSGHALDQMQGRGIPPSVVEHTIKVGKDFVTKAGTKGYYDAINNIRVIVSETSGKVVTIIRGSPK